jgi:proteasome lid subunit RPN8/RPN11
MTIEAWRKMLTFARLASPKEVIGYLYGEEKDNRITIIDVILPKQEVTSSHCEVIIDKTVTDIEHPENIKGLWHSHHNMGSFMSQEDKDTLNNFGADKVKYAFSVIVALPNIAKAWIKYFLPVEIDPIEVPIEYLWTDQEALDASCKALLDEKVSEKKYTVPQSIYTATGVTNIPGSKQSETGNAKDWQKGELAPIVEDLNCEHRQIGRNGAYCNIFGKPFICGTPKCIKGRKKTGDVIIEQGEKFEGCAYSYGCHTVKDGVPGCIWGADFIACQDCGLVQVVKAMQTVNERYEVN